VCTRSEIRIMKIEHKPVLIIVGVLAVLQIGLLFFFYGKDKGADLSPSEITLDGTLQNGETYALTIRKIPFERKLLKESGGNNLIGANEQQPDYLLEKIELSIGDKEVEFPLKAFRDLADPTLDLGVAISESGKIITLIIQGGGEGKRYQAKLKIRSNLFFERVIQSGSQEPVITKYHIEPEIRMASAKAVDSQPPTVKVIGEPIKLTTQEIEQYNSNETTKE